MSQSVDPNFAQRVAEYQKNAKKGQVFYAEGTIGGRKMRPPRKAWRARPIRSFLRVLLIIIAIKSILFHAGQVSGLNPYGDYVSQNIILQSAAHVIMYPDIFSVNFDKYMVYFEMAFANQLREIM